jgi:tetratricopeptide (TPR) repeat protein
MKPIRPWRTLAMVTLLILIAATLAVPTLYAQIPDKFTNLKILPKDISKDDLTATMRGFASSLGVRCGFCHVRKEGDPHGEFDWASDAKPEKTTARVMVQMMQMINTTQLPKVTVKDPDKVQVQCRTCHHGGERPFLVEDILSTAYKTGGLDSLKARYESLRKEYYGTDTYNFGVEMLPALGERLAGRSNPQESVRLAEYNLHWYPDSGEAHLAMGQALAAAGDKDKATEELKKAEDLDPSLKENVQWVLGHMKAK